MKKAIILLLAFAMLLCAACGSSASAEPSKTVTREYEGLTLTASIASITDNGDGTYSVVIDQSASGDSTKISKGELLSAEPMRPYVMVDGVRVESDGRVKSTFNIGEADQPVTGQASYTFTLDAPPTEMYLYFLDDSEKTNKHWSIDLDTLMLRPR